MEDPSEIIQKLQLAGKNRTKQEEYYQVMKVPIGEVLKKILEDLSTENLRGDKGSVVDNVKDLLLHADPLWLLNNYCQSETVSIVQMYVDLTVLLTQYSALPQCESDVGELPDSAYCTVPGRAHSVAEVFQILLSKLSVRPVQAMSSSAAGVPPSSVLNGISPHLVIFCATHCQEMPWTSAASRLAADELLAATVQASRCKTLVEFLCGSQEEGGGALGAVLHLMKPQMSKNTWKLNPATKHVFRWLLQRVRRPWLAEHLDTVLPPSLLFSDDYRTENKILGVRCLQHVIDNVPAAELLQYNRAQVVYHALFTHLYTPEASLIQTVLSCLLDLLPVIEKPHVTRGQQRANHYDKVFCLILSHMEVEDKIPLRRVYAKHLPVFIERLGILVVRHLKRLQRVILGYLEVYDGPEETARLCVLQAFQNMIQQAWPRMSMRLEVLLKSLLKFIYDVATDQSPTPPRVREELLHDATQCLILLNRCCERKVTVLLEGVRQNCENVTVLECLQRVQQDM
ncbi:TELO2-interacting protein 2 [Hypanus sabinus]|uniref:TELO2-interacting protein 2 n=1 Tax=Hypanus sabinus TaxID=79690 RepID=UPI0028C4D3A8|nr:TELO2-interacting protein 2 [Hypanus sabinus]XP_059823027.1 TELO2-interacting protein 2 [Hypanus sabinus]XP_059823035.1 TELO2-interacting protein 2 [Hypanus sabinus]